MSPVSPSRSHISSDRPPSDLDYWRVQLPSRPRAEQVARLVPHENASWDDASNLALLQLRAPVNLSAAPRPVCLPHPEHYFLPGSRCRLARWGRGGELGLGSGRAGRTRDRTRRERWLPPFLSQNPRPEPARCLRRSCWVPGGVTACMAARGRQCRRRESRLRRSALPTRRRRWRGAAG